MFNVKRALICKLNTLSNVDLGGDEVKSPSAEFDLSIFPEAKSSIAGVSVRYAHNSDKH